MAKKATRTGGASRVQRAVDQDTAAWLSGTETNPNTLTTKQRYNQERVRANLDVHPTVKQVLEQIAAAQKTSLAQAGGFLLAWAAQEYYRGNKLADAFYEARIPNPSPRAEYKLGLPEDWLGALGEVTKEV